MRRFFRQVPAEPSAVAEVRRELTAWAGITDAEARDDLSLAVSEVVSNSVKHGPAHCEITIEARAEDSEVLVEVCDAGTGGRIAIRAPDNAGGRGLRMLDTISRRWGVRRDPTCVWFVMRTRS